MKNVENIDYYTWVPISSNNYSTIKGHQTILLRKNGTKIVEQYSTIITVNFIRIVF